jgi:tetratricopeptide (TPR) repeat protein
MAGIAPVLLFLFLGQPQSCNPELASLADNHFQAARWAAAADLYEQSLSACPGDLRLMLRLADTLFRAQRLPEARDTAERFLRIQPNNAFLLKVKANSMYLLNDFTGAERTLLILLEKHPSDEDGAYMLGRMYYQEGQVEHATGMFQRVLRLNPKSHKAFDNLGLCYQSLGNNELAIRHFLTAIKLVDTDHPGYDSAYANLADLLLREGQDYSRAYAAAVKAARRNPQSARNFFLAGKALWKLNQIEPALTWLERATELDPGYSEPLYLLGQIHLKVGAKEKAAVFLERFKKAKAAEPAVRR